MRKDVLIISLILLVLISSGCISNGTSSNQKITVTSGIKESLESAAHEKEYGFYSLKESYPMSIEEIAEAKLVVCGDVAAETDLKVMIASLEDLNKLLFKSVSSHYINPNMLSGKMVRSEDVKLTRESGQVLQYQSKKSIYGKDISIETLVQKCLEDMQEGDKSVLLMKRDVGSQQRSGMLEIVFK